MAIQPAYDAGHPGAANGRFGQFFDGESVRHDSQHTGNALDVDERAHGIPHRSIGLGHLELRSVGRKLFCGQRPECAPWLPRGEREHRRCQPGPNRRCAEGWPVRQQVLAALDHRGWHVIFACQRGCRCDHRPGHWESGSLVSDDRQCGVDHVRVCSRRLHERRPEWLCVVRLHAAHWPGLRGRFDVWFPIVGRVGSCRQQLRRGEPDWQLCGNGGRIECAG